MSKYFVFDQDADDGIVSLVGIIEADNPETARDAFFAHGQVWGYAVTPEDLTGVTKHATIYTAEIAAIHEVLAGVANGHYRLVAQNGGIATEFIPVHARQN